MQESQYYERLLDTIRAYDSPYNRYSRLLRYLYSREFYWSVDNDGNRAEDAMRLRESYNYYNFLTPPSVLEVMVALAKRCESDIMGSDDEENKTAEWFWSMIDNLGCSGETDDEFDEVVVKRRVDMMLKRQYDRHGRYGLFYVKFPPKDMRTSELWYQMNWWLVENYFVRDDENMEEISAKLDW